MNITFYGACHMVTGSCYLVEHGQTKLLVDCGMIQGEQFTEDKNYDPFPFPPETIDYVLITHAHIDHCGRIPRLVREGFRGKIIATHATLDLAQLMLSDSAHVIQLDAERAGYPPLYSVADVDQTVRLFQGTDYHNRVQCGSITATWYDAGHILGSGFIALGDGTTSVVFSGDLGNPPVPLLRVTEPLPATDYVVMESTYGHRQHEPVRERKLLLSSAIYETVTLGGVLLIPAFALERTQELLYELNELVEQQAIPPVPVYIDSPLAIKATRIYPKYNALFNQQTKYLLASGDDIFKFKGLHFTHSTDQSRAIAQAAAPKIIVAGSGMMQGGRIRSHAQRYLGDWRNQVLIIGYQVAGSLGRQLLDNVKQVVIDDVTVPVKAKIRAIGAYSAHADQPKLLAWLATAPSPIRHIWLTHGEVEPATILAKVIQQRLGGTVSLPVSGQVETLSIQ